jgi:hypothetical protein
MNALERFQRNIAQLDQRSTLRITVGSKLSVLQFYPHTAQNLIEVVGTIPTKTIKEIHAYMYGDTIDSIEFTDGSTYPDAQFLDRGQGGGPLDGITTLFFGDAASADNALTLASMYCENPWSISSHNVEVIGESTTHKYKMKFEDFAPKQTQQLDEVRMGASDLDKFAAETNGVMAGFEAELCFPGLSGTSTETDYDNPEEDMDQDTRPDSIEEICDFFYDGDYNGRREIQSLREHLNEVYSEWRYERLSGVWEEVKEQKVREYIEENDYSFEDEVREYLEDTLELDREQAQSIIDAGEDSEIPEQAALFKEAADHANNVLNELTQEALDDQNYSYDRAREEWEDEYADDEEADEESWLRDLGVRWMSEVPSEFNNRNVSISWPHWTYPESESEGGFNEDAARDLASELADALGVNVRAGSGYHSISRRPGLWIIEADSSLEADDSDDMPAEIVSPPMPLAECLTQMQKFFEWAASQGAYSNSSTGLHVGVSLPHVGGNVDYLKLALFLGDQHVLQEFGRESNYYARSALEKVQSQVQSMTEGSRIADTLKVLQHGLTELAQKTLKTNANGYGKYTSINPKGDYIEFRSMGNDYMEKTDKVLEVVKRYAYAMYIAGRPDLHKQEYSKKLYKLLSSTGVKMPTAIELFSNFSSGQLDKESLIRQVRAIQSKRPGFDAAAQQKSAGLTGPELSGDSWFVRPYNNAGSEVQLRADSAIEALAKAKQMRPDIFGNLRDNEIEIRGSNGDYTRAYTLTLDNGSSNSGAGNAGNAGREFIGWKIVDAVRTIHEFSGIGNNQADANAFARRWIAQNGNNFAVVGELSVVPNFR